MAVLWLYNTWRLSHLSDAGWRPFWATISLEENTAGGIWVGQFLGLICRFSRAVLLTSVSAKLPEQSDESIMMLTVQSCYIHLLLCLLKAHTHTYVIKVSVLYVSWLIRTSHWPLATSFVPETTAVVNVINELYTNKRTIILSCSRRLPIWDSIKAMKPPQQLLLIIGCAAHWEQKANVFFHCGA